MSIRAHVEWLWLRQYFRPEPYDRDTNKKGDIRKRIEIDPPADDQLRAALLAITMPCVTCGTLMHPIRGRTTWKTWYFRASCPGNYSCRNNKATAAEYRAIVQDLLDAPPPPPTLAWPSLFD